MSTHRFVAINYITCNDNYRERFEELFSSRAHAIDRMPGFVDMQVLKPDQPDEPYLIVSHWDSKEAFDTWTQSPEFIEGHKRGFADVRAAKARGEVAPMESKFKTYAVIAR
ncbi:MAG TPA: antibiotic biosynthesis monooxygenase [bacterium]|nr:antibiotic biosynthesis monooxygenase [bacterium]HMW33004.1 antibiotic biosynthesis monooxygenase [bacterium]HMY35316.1 antibiotic biosynthesis monooxygenase [bacterium]HMZ04741.1 antibiotic biosynthesis monooxygenase [bacterium]HNB08675.1 antibiotic biosynthesis monooxygenase [bacterium]